MPPPCTIARLTRQPLRHRFVRSPLPSAASAKRATGKRFSPFYSIPPLSLFPSSDLPSFSFSPFSETPSRRMSRLPFHIRLRLWYSVLCGGVCITGFLMDAQTLFGQIKSLSWRLKVFARGNFKVQFLNGQSTSQSTWKVFFAMNELFVLRSDSYTKEFFIKIRSDKHKERVLDDYFS